jgi:hypothetical protein
MIGGDNDDGGGGNGINDDARDDGWMMEPHIGYKLSHNTKS